MKLPKIDVPMFDKNIMNSRSFWEQYNISIHSRVHLTDIEKLVYLRHSLQHGPATCVIKGLLGTRSEYSEAIECLQKCYDRPCILRHAHVQAIVEAPVVKHGSGKELRHLHDVCSQHLWASNVMKCKPSGALLTPLIEMILDESTMFEWERHSQDQPDVSHYTEILEIIKLRARVSKSTLCK